MEEKVDELESEIENNIHFYDEREHLLEENSYEKRKIKINLF